MMQHMLTTTDNPFDPFTQFQEWFAYDLSLGHNTTQFLARLISTSHELSDADEIEAMNFVIDEIVKENVLGKYRKVSKNVEEV